MKSRVACCLRVLLVLLVVQADAQAGSRQPDKAFLPPEQIALLTKEINTIASEHRARVFLLARVGRPREELPKGVEFTHVSLGVYTMVNTEDGRKVPAYAMYNLYQDDESPGRSRLAVDFPFDFLAGAREARIGLIIPRLDLQRRLYDVIHSDAYRKIHNPRYSAISNPYDRRYQNCTEYVLDVINAAIYGTDNPEQLKVSAKQHFKAQKIKINPLKLMLGSIVKDDIRTDDHRGAIRTATFGTLRTYLESNGLVNTAIVLAL